MPAEPQVPESVLVIRCSPSAPLEVFPAREPLTAKEQMAHARSRWAVREMVDRARLAEVEAERDRYRAWLERLREIVDREARLSTRALLEIIDTALGAESKDTDR